MCMLIKLKQHPDNCKNKKNDKNQRQNDNRAFFKPARDERDYHPDYKK